MTFDELRVTFDSVNEGNVEGIVNLTGGVPLYVTMFFEECGGDVSQYERAIVDSAIESLRRLQCGNDWDEICTSVCSSLLGIETSARVYDKKFFTTSQNATNNKFRYQALVPLVLVACREYLWDSLMSYIQEKEQLLLQVCADAATTNDARGRHFEHMVIQRCTHRGVRFQLGSERIEIPALRADFRFGGRVLQSYTLATANGVFVPLDPNFPAIDLVWKQDRLIIGVQVHVKGHDDVTSSFIGLCKHAGWFDEFDAVHLIYLSPEDAVMDLVNSLVTPPTHDSITTQRQPSQRINRRAISKNSIDCLRDLQWPAGCSLR
jgi:hypothetical protein